MSDDLDICYRSDLREVENNLLEQNKRLEASLVEASKLIKQISKQLDETNRSISEVRESLNEKITTLDKKFDNEKIELNKTISALASDIKNIITDRDAYRSRIRTMQDPRGMKIKELDKKVFAMDYAIKNRFSSVVGKNPDSPTDKNLFDWVYIFWNMINEYEGKLKGQ